MHSQCAYKALQAPLQLKCHQLALNSLKLKQTSCFLILGVVILWSLCFLVPITTAAFTEPICISNRVQTQLWQWISLANCRPHDCNMQAPTCAQQICLCAHQHECICAFFNKLYICLPLSVCVGVCVWVSVCMFPISHSDSNHMLISCWVPTTPMWLAEWWKLWSVLTWTQSWLWFTT